MNEAEDITKKSNSNLAFAFICLPKQRRADMVTLYAFCRIVDDLADSPDLPAEEKISGLAEWRACFTDTPPASPSQLQRATLQLRDRYRIDNQHFLELIDGCASDLEPSRRFDNWQQLEQYTYQVACCVGLISIKIFGCTSPISEKYAVSLGHALQLTNILRDVGEDLDDNRRVYLPLADMEKFGYSEQDLIAKTYDQRFIDMMKHIANRAEKFYSEAVASLPAEDKKALRSSEAMRKIYHAILKKMQADKFQVFHQRYTLSKPRKAWLLLSSLLGF